MPKKNTKTPSNNDLKNDLASLGSLLKSHFIAAWNSSQRKDAEKAVAKGVASALGAVKSIVADAKKGKLEGKIRAGLHSALKKSNEELAKAKKVWKPAAKKTKK